MDALSIRQVALQCKVSTGIRAFLTVPFKEKSGKDSGRFGPIYMRKKELGAGLTPWAGTLGQAGRAEMAEVEKITDGLIHPYPAVLQTTPTA